MKLFAFRWFPDLTAIALLIAIPVLYVVDGDIVRSTFSALCVATIYGWKWILRTRYMQGLLMPEDSLAVLNIWTFTMIGNALGSLGLYYSLFYYDLALHFIFPFLGAEACYIALHSIAIRRQKHLPKGWVQRSTAIGIASGAILACIIGWEVFEYISDVLFQTAMSFQIGDDHDTLSDVLAGLAGVAVAALLERRQWTRIFPEREQ